MSFNEPPDLWDLHAQQFPDLDYEGPPYIPTPEEDFTAYIQDLVDEVTDYCCIKFRPDRYEPLAYGRSVPKMFSSIRERIRVVSTIQGDALYQQESEAVYQKVAKRLGSYGMVASRDTKRFLSSLLKQHLSEIQGNNTRPGSVPDVITPRAEMAAGFDKNHGTDRVRDQEISSIMESVTVADRIRAMHAGSNYATRLADWDWDEDDDAFATPGIPERNAESYNDTPLANWKEDEDEDMFATPRMEVGIFNKKAMEGKSVVTPEELSPNHETVEEDAATPTPAPRIRKPEAKKLSVATWEKFCRAVHETIPLASAGVRAVTKAYEDGVSGAALQEIFKGAHEAISTAVAAISGGSEEYENGEGAAANLAGAEARTSRMSPATFLELSQDASKALSESMAVMSVVSENLKDREEAAAESEESSDCDVQFVKSSKKVIIEISSDESEDNSESDESSEGSEQVEVEGSAAESEEASDSDSPPPVLPPSQPKKRRANAMSTKPQSSKKAVVEEPAADSDESYDDENSEELEEDTPPKKRRATAHPDPAKLNWSTEIDWDKY